MEIQDVLNRRTDLSTFVVHLARDEILEPSDGGAPVLYPAEEKLRSIIRERRLVAATPMGLGWDQDDPNDPAKQTQRAVCFSETPLEHVYALVADIAGRQIKLEPYGVALTKVVARRFGVNPVWYVDMTPSGHDWLTTPIRELKDAAVATESFHTQPIARLLPFFDWMGGPFPTNPTKKEFWWEREWRHAGNVQLGPIWDKILWLCPADEQDAFRERVLAATPEGETASDVFIDPRWGVEQIIAHLAGLPREDATLFEASPGHVEPVEPPPF